MNFQYNKNKKTNQRRSCTHINSRVNATTVLCMVKGVEILKIPWKIITVKIARLEDMSQNNVSVKGIMIKSACYFTISATKKLPSRRNKSMTRKQEKKSKFELNRHSMTIFFLRQHTRLQKENNKQGNRGYFHWRLRIYITHDQNSYMISKAIVNIRNKKIMMILLRGNWKGYQKRGSIFYSMTC